MKLFPRAILVGCLALACTPDEPGSATSPERVPPPAPRTPLVGAPVQWVDGFDHLLVVKFRDGAGVDLAARQVVDEHAITLAPLLATPRQALLDLERRAEARSGVKAPDLGSLFSVSVAGGRDELLAAARALERLGSVEFVSLEPIDVPPPGDISPPTPSFSHIQTYRNPAYGIDAVYAAQQGLTGAGVRVYDLEYSWTTDHEDLIDVDIQGEPGQTPAGYHADHGTAVIGVLVAPDNGYGVTGLLPGIELHTYSEHTYQSGPRRVQAIASALADARAGDIVLLEMQTIGAGGGYVPAEWSPAVWMLTRTAADAGIIVVAAAGNGGQNLDDADHAEYMERGDSGAIIVGAGSAWTRGRLSFSTHGSRVDVQGWGDLVVTLGYGDLGVGGAGSKQAYAGQFTGTSAASPIVVAACALLQAHAIDELGRPLSPAELRNLLVTTGRPQPPGDGGHIGPLPNVRAAIEALEPE